MTTLIIPCAGSSTLDGKPTCIAVHPDGKYLFEKCISCIDLTKINRIVISILASDDLKYDIESKINVVFDSEKKVDVCKIPFRTNDPAETIYRTIKAMKITGRIIIKDVDNSFCVEDMSYENFVAGLNIFDYDIRGLGSKSFVTVNEQGYILDIIEKQIKSGIICTGFYGFSRAEDFLKFYEILKDEIYDIKKIYVSHIIAYLIGRFGEIFKYVESGNFESYGNQNDWEELKSCYAKSLIRKDKLALFDMDGTLFNTNEVNYRAYKESLENFGYKFEREYWYKNCVGRHYKDFLADIDITDEKLLNDIHGLKKQAYPKYLKYAQENRHLFEIIDTIKPRYNIALVTTASRKNVEDILYTFNKINVFDKIFTQEDMTKMKPDPECYFNAMQYFGVKPEDTIIFEDSDAGLIAAKLSGAFCYQVFGFNDSN